MQRKAENADRGIIILINISTVEIRIEVKGKSQNKQGNG